MRTIKTMEQDLLHTTHELEKNFKIAIEGDDSTDVPDDDDDGVKEFDDPTDRPIDAGRYYDGADLRNSLQDHVWQRIRESPLRTTNTSRHVMEHRDPKKRGGQKNFTASCWTPKRRTSIGHSLQEVIIWPRIGQTLRSL